MNNSFATITRWIVAFLVIFLLCMLLVFSWLKRPKEGQPHRPQRLYA